MNSHLAALFAGLLVGGIVGFWLGGNWILWGEIGRAIRGPALPDHSLRGGRPYMPRRDGVEP